MANGEPPAGNRMGFLRRKLGQLSRKIELRRCAIETAVTPPFLLARSVHKARGALRSCPQAGNSRRRLFVDLSVIGQDDAGTGIQRVVRALAMALSRQDEDAWEVHFVAAAYRRPYYRIAWPADDSSPDFAPIAARPGDVFLGLDYALDSVRRHERQLRQFKADGGRLWFLVHDLLPLHHPEWFSRNTVIRYSKWLHILAKFGDGFLCNSEQTETDLRAMFVARYRLATGYRTQVLPMGADLSESIQPSANAAVSATDTGRFSELHPFVMMVGTLEPRKGHADVVQAFDVLWRAGCRFRLVIIGRLGWRVDDLRLMIESHSEFGRRLFWYDDIDDATLMSAYRACEGVIVASRAEGFGLPLIEALGYGRPVLARDLPVFRPHEPLGVRYFPANADAETLAAEIRRWLRALKLGEVAISRPLGDWRRSADVLLAAIAQC